MSDETTSATPLLRNINFWLFVVNRSSNVIGIHSLTVAVGWYVYKLTGDPLDLGLIGLAQFAPALVLFLFAGMAADRFDRRRIMVACNIVHGLAVALAGGYREHDILVVTEKGAENITHFPYGPEHNIIAS